MSAVLKAIQAAATRVESLSALAAGSWLVALKTDTYVLPWQCAGLQAKALHSFLGRQSILLPVRTEPWPWASALRLPHRDGVE